jgi:hypothetical protein
VLHRQLSIMNLFIYYYDTNKVDLCLFSRLSMHVKYLVFIVYLLNYCFESLLAHEFRDAPFDTIHRLKRYHVL